MFGKQNAVRGAAEQSGARQDVLSWIAVAAAVTGLVSCSPTASQSTGVQPTQVSSGPTAPIVRATPQSHGSLPDFTGLVEQFGKAVVNVEITRRQRTVSTPFSMPDADPFAEFFRRFGIPAPVPRSQEPPVLRGSGSGFIVQSRWLHSDQRARRRERRRGARAPDRQTRVSALRSSGAIGARTLRVIKIDAHGSSGPCASAITRGSASRRVGAGDRLTVRARELRHRGHRECDLARGLAARPMCPSSRPTSPSIPGIPADRSSICAARLSASIR